MAFIQTDKEKQDQLDQQAQEQKPQESEIKKTGEGTEPIAGEVGPTSSKQASTGMKGAQASKYVAANQDPNLAERIQSKLQTQEKALGEKAEGVETQVETDTGYRLGQNEDLERTGTGEAQRLYNVSQYAPTIARKSSAEINAFMQDKPRYSEYQKAVKGEYNAPDLSAIDPMKKEAQSWRDLAAGGQTEAGRFKLLREMFNRPEAEYSGGQQSLDNLLLQQAPGQANKLAEYAKVAGLDVLNKAGQIEKLGQKATAQISADVASLQTAVKESAVSEFQNVKLGIQDKIDRYNFNVQNLNSIIQKAITNESLSGSEIEFFRNTASPALKQQLADIKDKNRYTAAFGTGWQGPLRSAPNKGWQTELPSMSAESATYDYPELTGEALNRLIVERLRNRDLAADIARFTSGEDIARQTAIEQLYTGRQDVLSDVAGDFTGNLRLSSSGGQLLDPQSITKEGLNIDKYLKERDIREKMVEQAARDTALGQADFMDKMAYNLDSRFGSVGAGDYEDPVAASYKYFDPATNAQYKNMSRDDAHRTVLNDPRIRSIMGVVGEGKNAEVNDRINNPQKYGFDDAEHALRAMHDGQVENMNMYALEIADRARAIEEEKQRRGGGQFEQLKRIFG